MKINPIVNDYHFLIYPEMQVNEKYWCATTAEYKLSVTGYGDTPRKALKDLKKHLTSVIECMSKNNEPVVLPMPPTHKLKILEIDFDEERTPGNWTKFTSDRATWPKEGSWCWLFAADQEKVFTRPIEFYQGGFVHWTSTSGVPQHLPFDNMYWSPAIPPEFE